MRLTTTIILVAILTGGCQKGATQRERTPRTRISTEVSKDNSVPMTDRVTAAKRKLRDELANFGLSRVADVLEKRMAVSIRLTAASASHDVKLGSSKLGGTPDLPEGTMWPQCNGVPMALLAQLRLQDLNPYDTDGWLPKSGILYFFYEAKDQVWGFDPKDRGHWSVIYHDGDLEKLRPTKPPAGLPEECRFQPCELGFHNEITLPSWDSQEVDRLKLSEKEGDTYINLLDAGVGSSHRMFGHPDQVQGDMTLECQLVSHGISTGSPEGFADPRRAALEKGADDWKLLLQVDSDAELGTMWGDSGRIYFWIRDQDLKKRDFSNVWLVLQCY